MDTTNNLQKFETPTNSSIDYSDQSQITIADKVVANILQKEETFMNKYFPSREDKARREKDIELINQALGDRNKMYAILRETQIKNFTIVANDFLTQQLAKGETGKVKILTTAINDAIIKIDEETGRFYQTIQNKLDRAENWKGSAKEMIQKDTDQDIKNLSEKFNQIKEDLMIDLSKIREKLIK